MTINHVTVRCACGAVIGSHWCPCIFPATEAPVPAYTLDAIEPALRTALGGAVPQWMWDVLTACLEGAEPWPTSV